MPTILFTSAGRRVALLENFRQAMRGLGVRGRLVTADMRADAPAHHVADARVALPPIDAPDYLDAVMDACREHGVDLVIPILDAELPVFAEAREAFARRGVRVVVSSPEAIATCQDKRTTADFFTRSGFPTPATVSGREAIDAYQGPFPALLKPAFGSSSHGVQVVHDAEELRFFAARTDEPVLQDYQTGNELTLDVFCDFEGRARCVVPRMRIQTRGGEVSKGVTVKDPAVIEAGRAVAEALPGAQGPLNIQCFRNADEEPTFIEINPRFGGGYPLSARAGADFARWLLALHLGRDPDIREDWQDGLVMMRYDAAVFVPKAQLSPSSAPRALT